MSQTTDPTTPAPDRSRVTAMIITAVIHVAMLAALIAVSPDLATLPGKPVTIITLPGMEAEKDGEAASDGGATPAPAAVAASPDEGTPPPPPMPVPMTVPLDVPVAPPMPFDPATIDFGTPVFDAEPDPATTGDAAATASAGAGSGDAGSACPLVEALRVALERDPRALAALASIPRGSRSVANAVQMWDGRWIAPERAGGRATTDTIRAALATVMDDASDVCRTQINLGPVFVPVTTGATGTIVLAFGSGGWRWQDLLREVPNGSSGPVPYQRVESPNKL